MQLRLKALAPLLMIFGALLALHYPLLRLPYFWDEAGYYIPAAVDFYRAGLLIPQSTLPVGHPPLVMVYLGLAWHLFGFSPMVTRAAMILVASASVSSLYALGRRVAGCEVAAWSALLLALSPLFFAQSSLAHLDLAAALFTTLAVLFLLERRWWGFALVATLAVLSKETAVVLLPVAWLFAWRARPLRLARNSGLAKWAGLALPLLPLAVWAAYYRHKTGYWTGNPEYLRYNLYSTLDVGRFFWSLLRRLYELLIGGFNWLLVAGAALGMWRGRSDLPGPPETPGTVAAGLPGDFMFLLAGLTAAYLGMHSLVGGAILPRYLLPIVPLGYLLAVALMGRLPKALARTLSCLALSCFVGAWFINPPYPFPFEDNLAYADFVRLHQQAAAYLEAQPGQPRILTAWPASDELTRPFLGYVRKPLRVVRLSGFTSGDFSQVGAESFDRLYLYSHKWEPTTDWLKVFPQFRRIQELHFDYAPQVADEVLVARFKLKLLAQFERRGQWVRIYAR